LHEGDEFEYHGHWYSAGKIIKRQRTETCLGVIHRQFVIEVANGQLVLDHNTNLFVER
jgi:hypothetical protein